MDGHSSQQVPPALFSLSPELAHHMLQYLSKRDKQQFSLSCKHASVCALASIRSLVLSHKVLAHCKALKLKTMKYCAGVTLRPRAMDELTKLASLLLVHNLHRFPNLTNLRLELLGVYDKQCDVSLILKSVVLHAKQLTGLHIEHEAQVSMKALAYTAELPLLERLSVRTRSGFEPGALGQLSRAVNVTSLQLEVLPPGTNTATCSNGSNSRGPLSPSAAAQAGTTPVKSLSELARLQAADEVGLAKMAGQLQSFSASGFSSASSVRPVTALLAAVAGGPKPRLAELQLGAQEVPGLTLNLIASITSLHALRLMHGCDLTSALELSRLSCLGALTQLVVAPVQPPTPVLAAWVKGCKHLANLAVAGQPGPLPLTPCMPGITALQLLGSAASSSRHGSSTGTVDVASLSITLRSPLSLSGLESLWPRLTSLEVTGWALDTGSINAILLLEGLTRIQLKGGREPGTALHAGTLLPLVTKPGLRQLLLLEVCDIHDAWVSDAVVAAKAPCSDGSAPAVRELHLCTPDSDGATPPNSGSGSEGGGSSRMLTDNGLMQLAAWPRLSSLVLRGMPGITLAGVKALVGGCPTLTELHVQGCPAVSAAPSESVSKAAGAPAGRAVTLCVS